MHIISFLLSCSFLFLQIENKNIDEIVIKYVNYNVYTYQNIGCKEFENFSEKIKTINIKDKNEIDRLGRIVRKLTITKSNTPDVRVKIEFKHAGARQNIELAQINRKIIIGNRTTISIY